MSQIRRAQSNGRYIFAQARHLYREFRVSVAVRRYADSSVATDRRDQLRLPAPGEARKPQLRKRNPKLPDHFHEAIELERLYEQCIGRVLELLSDIHFFGS
jgi:hypothetical protein